MPDLTFVVEKVEPALFAAAPQLTFTLGITSASPTEQVHSVLLRCQVRIEPTRRSYQPDEKEKLRDLFGEPSRWGQTVRSMLWTHTNIMVPSFQGSTSVELPVPCTFDFNVAATRYFHSLCDGAVHLRFLFSGSIFHEGEDGALQVAQISWEKETTFALAVRVWKEMMDHYYPAIAWMCLPRDIFDRLSRYKAEQGIATWEQTLERLLERAQQAKP